MHPEITARLLDINRLFYQNFAAEFSATRQRVQPGVLKVMNALPVEARILDLGCGNGALAYGLGERGQKGLYVGLDNSPGLLEAAQQAGVEHRKPGWKTEFYQADLAQPDQVEMVSSLGAPYDIVLAFASLHHVPGDMLRARLVQKVAALLRRPGGRFFHSEWQFLNSPRLVARLLPWETIGLSQDQVDPGDYLLDWRAGGRGLRYVHAFTEAELAALAAAAGLRIRQTFYSDGREGNLALYQEWEGV